MIANKIRNYKKVQADEDEVIDLVFLLPGGFSTASSAGGSSFLFFYSDLLVVGGSYS